MLILVILSIFATAVNGVYGWKTGNIYTYKYKGCYRGSNASVYVGELTADLYIQPITSDKLFVSMLHVRDRSIDHANETETCETFPSNEENVYYWNYKNETFEISFEKGVVTALDVNQDVDSENLVLIKAVASQLQLDLQGEHCKDPKSCQLPTETKLNAVYQATENSTAGLCETQYEVSPSEQLFKVVKTTDFKTCLCSNNGSGKSKLNKYATLKNTNNVVVSGNLKEYVIQSTNSKLEGVGLPTSESLPSPTMVWFASVTLISTNPAVSQPDSISNSLKANLMTWC